MSKEDGDKIMRQLAGLPPADEEVFLKVKQCGYFTGDTVPAGCKHFVAKTDKRIAELEAELDQCLTAHAKLNDECERMKEYAKELQQRYDIMIDSRSDPFNLGMERAAEIAMATEVDCVVDAHAVISAAIRKEIK